MKYYLFISNYVPCLCTCDWSGKKISLSNFFFRSPVFLFFGSFNVWLSWICFITCVLLPFIRDYKFFDQEYYLKQEIFDYSHVPGQAVLHRGRHRHGARATTSGHRINLLLWCRRYLNVAFFFPLIRELLARGLLVCCWTVFFCTLIIYSSMFSQIYYKKTIWFISFLFTHSRPFLKFSLCRSSLIG